MPAALFDLDGTLIVADFVVSESLLEKNHLSKVQIPGCQFSHYVIHLKIIASIFQQLRSKNITIGIITASEYDKEEIISLFNRIFNLNPPLNIQDCLFIGRNDYGHAYTDKGEKIFAAQQDGKLPLEHQDIALIDDDHQHIASAQRRGYRTIIAGGFPHDITNLALNREQNHSYLREIIELFDLDVSLPDDFARHKPIKLNSYMLNQFKTRPTISPASSIISRNARLTDASYHSLDTEEEACCSISCCWGCIKCLACAICGPKYY